MIKSTSTIAALATAPGQGGVAIIRVSGSLAPFLLKRLFFPKKSIASDTDWKTHHLYIGVLKDTQERVLDEAMAVWMKAPHSFTGEDVVEFHLHGGALIVSRVLKVLYEQGVEPARPGEFSERGFLNGKMDLTQAEAIADMIAASSERALKMAQAQWQGQLSKPVSELRKHLLELLVQLEASIDFPEEDLELAHLKTIEQLIFQSKERIQKWLEDYETGRLIREGLVVALVGKPNVGKSSLLNRMLNEEAAIVHHVPGTTRDPIERPIQLGGFALRLVDTAGIREASDYVEQKGIERSKDWIEKSDLILALFDRSCPLEEEDIKIFEAASKKKCLFLFNKSDLKACWSLEDFLKFFSPFNISLSERQVISISTKTEEGIACLEKSIPQLFGIDSLENQEILYLNQVRHKNALLKALNALDLALKNLSSYSVEFIATDIRVASEALGEIVGEISTEDVLEDIFSRFCIGK